MFKSLNILKIVKYCIKLNKNNVVVLCIHQLTSFVLLQLIDKGSFMNFVIIKLFCFLTVWNNVWKRLQSKWIGTFQCWHIYCTPTMQLKLEVTIPVTAWSQTSTNTWHLLQEQHYHYTTHITVLPLSPHLPPEMGYFYHGFHFLLPFYLDRCLMFFLKNTAIID